MKSPKYSNIAILAVLISNPAYAEQSDDSTFEPAFYVTGGVGQSKHDFTFDDDSSTVWRLGGGYQFNQYFSAEFNYRDLGSYDTLQIDYERIIDIDPAFGGVNIPVVLSNVDAKGYELSAIGRYPFATKFAVKGRLGFLASDYSSSVVGSVSGEDLLYGVGAEYSIGEKFTLTLEYETADDYSDWMLGINYSF